MPSPCLRGYFACNTTDMCVEQRYNCDKVPDCDDGSDEWSCDDEFKKQLWNSLWRKRADEDREKRTRNCELPTKPEKCWCSAKSVFCENTALRQIPKNVAHDVKEIDLSANKLHNISADDFPLLEKLEVLILTGSNIKKLSPFAFRNAPVLRNLYLSANLIEHLHNNTFDGLYFLDLLILSHNPLSTIDIGAFQGLDRIEELCGND
ncbi:hypothetical protein B4U79_14544 [Dinothrombium tinctorium]|uniref:Uncharacterized protein n=1 Tax=Dinothrombium tinctorium TaxID=1965070 RepID=A0A3S3S8B1_9ACAR|nr:hypothetical protein B4U79_09809 [Dinothrombium tinctorium]RWS10209.1 hypothetical protein B4U79_15458 [Dinothrombium tinctorium]RWS10556.1 hypothetical protein B4U79_14544 [Dinothrombium tinctorium]